MWALYLHLHLHPSTESATLHHHVATVAENRHRAFMFVDCSGIEIRSTKRTPVAIHLKAGSLVFPWRGDIFLVLCAGFGNISPHTEGGRIFCIVYALLGIPLFGFLLAGVGDQLGTIFSKGIGRVEKTFVVSLWSLHLAATFAVCHYLTSLATYI